jgi:hypothetical protein
MFVMSRTTTSLLPVRVTNARVRLDGADVEKAGADWLMEQGVAIGEGDAEKEEGASVGVGVTVGDGEGKTELCGWSDG